MGEGAIHDADVDALLVHGVEGRGGVVAALAHRPVEGVGGGVEECLRADDLFINCPGRDHAALHVPMGEVGRAPAQVLGAPIPLGPGEVILVHVAHLDDVQVAVHHPEAVLYGASPPLADIDYSAVGSAGPFIPLRIPRVVGEWPRSPHRVPQHADRERLLNSPFRSVYRLPATANAEYYDCS